MWISSYTEKFMKVISYSSKHRLEMVYLQITFSKIVKWEKYIDLCFVSVIAVKWFECDKFHNFKISILKVFGRILICTGYVNTTETRILQWYLIVFL